MNQKQTQRATKWIVGTAASAPTEQHYYTTSTSSSTSTTADTDYTTMAASDIGEASVLVASKRVVYVGGLGEEVSQAILRSSMIPFGNIKSLDIPMDYKAGKTRGFAFVEFEDPDDGK